MHVLWIWMMQTTMVQSIPMGKETFALGMSAASRYLLLSFFHVLDHVFHPSVVLVVHPGNGSKQEVDQWKGTRVSANTYVCSCVHKLLL